MNLLDSVNAANLSHSQPVSNLFMRAPLRLGLPGAHLKGEGSSALTCSSFPLFSVLKVSSVTAVLDPAIL